MNTLKMSDDSSLEKMRTCYPGKLLSNPPAAGAGYAVFSARPYAEQCCK